MKCEKREEGTMEEERRLFGREGGTMDGGRKIWSSRRRKGWKEEKEKGLRGGKEGCTDE